MLIIEILHNRNRITIFDTILDIDDKTESKSNLSVSELTELSNLKVSTFLATSVPKTDKNTYLLLAFDRYYKVPVRVREDSNEYPISEAYWTSYDDKDIEITFVYEERTIAEKLRLLTLDSINYWKWGTLLLDRTGLENNWANGHRWVDETPPIYLAPIIYNCTAGRLYQTNEIDYTFDKTLLEVTLAVQDMRPLISPLFVCKEMFAKIGYQFKSPYLESDFGRELWSYILAEDFGTGYGGQQYKFRLSLEQTNAVPDPIPIQQEWVFLTDSGAINTNNYDPATNAHLDTFPQPNGFPNPEGYWENTYTVPTKWTFRAFFKGVRHNYEDNASVKCMIEVYEETSTGITIFDKAYLEPVIKQSEIIDVNVVWENAIILPNQRVRLKCFCDSGITLYASVQYGTYIEGAVSDANLYYKDEVRFKVRKDNCFDYLNGIIHTCKGKLLINYTDKSVTLYPTENTNLFDTQIEGYYKEISQEFETYNPKVSRNLDKFKEIRVGYKTAQYLNTKETDDVFVYEGNDSTAGTIDYINPYFTTLREGKAVSNDNLPNCPYLGYINTKEKIVYENSVQEFKVNPFLVKAFGFIELSRFDTPFTKKVKYEYPLDPLDPKGKQKFVLATDTKEANDTVYFKIPYVAQTPTNTMMNNQYLLENVGFTGKAKSLAYFFYNNDLFYQYNYEFLSLDINPNFILSSTFFRYPIKTFLNGHTKTLWATDIQDYQANLPILVKAKERQRITDYYDSYWVRRVYQQPTQVSTIDRFNAYLISFKIDGAEKIDIPIKVHSTPIYKTIGAITYEDNWLEVLGIFYKTEFYIEGASNNLFTITFPKGVHISATFSKSDNKTAFNDYIWRFDSDGTYYNAHEGSINYAFMNPIDLGNNIEYYKEFKKITE